MKKLIILATLLALAGCCTTPTITTKTVPVAVPLIYSPAPPVVARPELPHLTIKPQDEKNDGKVVQAYAASVEALIGYSEQLEKIVAQYAKINKAYAVQRDKLIKSWKDRTGQDITVPDPTVPVSKP